VKPHMFATFIIGTAGSGKSFLTSAFSDWLKLKGQDVITINLDPGVLDLPYTPDIDIREYISINALAKKYQLGPNGALLMAADLIATEIGVIKDEIQDINADYILIDTPGQMELFAFRVSGPYIVAELLEGEKALLYLFDAPFSTNPLNYVSNLFLASAVHLRLFLPQIYILSKIDLIPEDELTKIIEWGTADESLEIAIEEKLSGTQRLLSRDILHIITNLGLSFSLLPISSKSKKGFTNLHALLLRIFTGGGEII
jgi:GTPase SAR1 family protein